MSHTIVLIDDDSDDREFFLDAVAAVAADLNVVVLQSGITLVSDLDKGIIPLPDLILLDINIPEMNGWTCLSLLKEHKKYSGLPVIMYSTSSHQEEAKRAKLAGAVGFFSKPFEFKDLKEAVKEIKESLDQNTIPEIRTHYSRFY